MEQQESGAGAGELNTERRRIGFEHVEALLI
jgi:hypothetical protein